MKPFKTIYQELLPLLKNLEKTRHIYSLLSGISIASLQVFLFCITLFIFLGILSSMGIVSSSIISGFSAYISFFPIPVAFVPILGVLAAFFAPSMYEAQHKIIEELVKEMAPGFKYKKYKTIKSRDIERSSLFPFFKENQAVYVMGNGGIEGTIENVEITFSSIALTSSSPYGRINFLFYLPVINLFAVTFLYLRPLVSRKKIEDIYPFKGLFIMADLPKKIKGRTIVLPDTLEKKIGFLAQSIQSLSRQGELAYMESPEFENEFVVYTTDQIEARYVLTPNIMYKILDLKRKANRALMLSFTKNKVYIAMPGQTWIFDLLREKSALNRDFLKTIYDDILLALGIVNDLGLNINIWSAPPNKEKIQEKEGEETEEEENKKPFDEILPT